MPLHAARLRDSELASNETPEACWAAVLLWCASWHQVPAASMPDDDMWLASQANYAARGKIDKAWNKVRAGALRGWVKCADGRLYHPVVAEQALEAWLSKLVSSLSGATGNAKRWGIEIDTEAVKAQIVDAAARLRAIAPRSEWLKKTQVRNIVTASPPDAKNNPPRSDDESPPDQDANRPPIAAGVAPDCDRIANEMKRNEVNTIGTKGGIGTSNVVEPVDNSGVPPPIPRAAEIAILLRKHGASVTPANPHFMAWAERDVTDEQALDALAIAKRRRADAGSQQPINAGFLDSILCGEVLAAASKPAKPSRHHGIAETDFREGVSDDGRF
ncbi:YdaU family protein [Ralstonia syzygii]|uniref:YdaU family protein n=1 Tax=Ralstonia syzygii TaxID=28097 RepID=UPI001E28F79F|nr:YdaU family protein [Ralstonia syzygii]